MRQGPESEIIQVSGCRLCEDSAGYEYRDIVENWRLILSAASLDKDKGRRMRSAMCLIGSAKLPEFF